MKKLKIFLVFLLSMVGAKALAYDVKIDGIYYNLWGTDAQVTRYSKYSSGDYSGNVIIPESITYNGKTYIVSSIGGYAFYYCTNLLSVTIPNSVNYFYEGAFYGCSRLTSITIPNSVTSIGNSAFYYCI